VYQIQVRERFQDKLLYFRSFIHWLMKFNHYGGMVLK
jgi:hypothetical protein